MDITIMSVHEYIQNFYSRYIYLLTAAAKEDALFLVSLEEFSVSMQQPHEQDFLVQKYYPTVVYEELCIIVIPTSTIMSLHKGVINSSTSTSHECRNMSLL
ncbi:hypothetical protein NQ317_013973 [Molorchus minor]|uniref:Uncharacterized protein n=1 Tax=Molorchus minor TaxID=1323400 RepID=A0ABQ9IW98_9CUCU|nr:hypothetical protein NQ317_013973 [Molorchus minor]